MKGRLTIGIVRWAADTAIVSTAPVHADARHLDGGREGRKEGRREGGWLCRCEDDILKIE